MKDGSSSREKPGHQVVDKGPVALARGEAGREMSIRCADHHCDIDLCGCDADAQYRQALVGGILAKHEREKRARAAKLPSERECLAAMFEGFARLKELGWNEAIYCPKDGSIFDSISAGSTGIHPCHYEGKWPKGSWWVHEAGDLWPARPILWRAAQQTPPSASADCKEAAPLPGMNQNSVPDPDISAREALSKARGEG